MECTICLFTFNLFFSSATSEKKVQIKSQNPREKIWQGIECRIIKFVFRSSSSYSKCFVIYNIRNQLEANCEFFSLYHFHENSGVILFLYYSKKVKKICLSRFHFQKKNHQFCWLFTFCVSLWWYFSKLTYFFHFVTLISIKTKISFDLFLLFSWNNIMALTCIMIVYTLSF